MTARDKHFMEMALAEGLKNLGVTAENPSVGCVIVKDNKVLAKAVTAQGGRPHAETAALAMAGERAVGSTVYVTLEPCAHHGVTPPCCQALISARVSRVVTALADPDPRTAGEGHAALRLAGIELVTNVCEAQARANLAGFLSRIERGRPYIILKMAQSADGMISAAPGERSQITGTAAFEYVHTMRAQADAIMVGADTVRIDDPSLTCRLEGRESCSPIRIVVSSNPSSLAGASMMNTADDVPVWILSTTEGPARIKCAMMNDTDHVDLLDAVTRLAERGIGRLMVEGGARLAESLLEQDLVDEIVQITAPHKLGPDGVKSPIWAPDRNKFSVSGSQNLGVDKLTTYVRTTP